MVLGEDCGESPELQGDPTVHPKGEISPGCSLEGLMLEAETPILWPSDAKS